MPGSAFATVPESTTPSVTTPAIIFVFIVIPLLLRLYGYLQYRNFKNGRGKLLGTRIDNTAWRRFGCTAGLRQRHFLKQALVGIFRMFFDEIIRGFQHFGMKVGIVGNDIRLTAHIEGVEKNRRRFMRMSFLEILVDSKLEHSRNDIAGFAGIRRLNTADE